MDDDTVDRGSYIAPEVKEQYESLRAFFDARASLDRIDNYGRWIFASSAIVGALGAGLSNASLPRAHAWSLLPLTASILCLGVSLVAASQSIAPHVMRVSLNDLESMRAAVNQHFLSRQRYVNFGARFYALAILLAALVPLSSLLATHVRPRLAYTIDAKGDLDADVLATDLKQGDALELDVDRPAIPLTSAGLVAGSSGEGSLHLGPLPLGPGDTALILRQRASGQAGWKELERISLRR